MLIYVCVCVCPRVCWGPQRLEEHMGCLRAGVTSVCEPPDVGAGAKSLCLSVSLSVCLSVSLCVSLSLSLSLSLCLTM